VTASTFPDTTDPDRVLDASLACARLSGVVIYADPTGTVLAPITTLSGVPIPGSKVEAPGGCPAPFRHQAGATVLYLRTAGGQVAPLYPLPASPPASKGRTSGLVVPVAHGARALDDLAASVAAANAATGT
jgi:hypothetical protein